MSLSSSRARCAIAASALALAPAAIGQTLSDDDTQRTLDEITISESKPGKALAADAAFASQQAGNVTVVPRESFDERYALTFRDSLALTPGVVTQPRFGEDSRLSIRGSGLSQNIHLRGIDLFFDGIPINAADGFGDFQEIDTTFISHITVNRGANAFRSGTATLGGSVEISGLQADRVPSRVNVTLEGGSFGTGRVNLTLAEDFGRFDALAAVSYVNADGFRTNAGQNTVRAYGNFGFRWTDNIESRVGIILNSVRQNLPGSVSLETALTTPDAPADLALPNMFARDIDSARLFVQNTADLGAVGTVNLGGSYTRRELIHPVGGVFIDQEVQEYSIDFGYEGGTEIGEIPVEWAAGFRFRNGDNDALLFLNALGEPGFQIGDSLQRADTFQGFIEVRAEVLPRLTLIGGINLLRTERDFEDNLNPEESDFLAFEDIAPRGGILFELTENIDLFANISTSFEAPNFFDLNQAGGLGFIPLEAQESLNYEVGARGTLGAATFEVALFRSDLEDEFIAISEDPQIPAMILNATGDTVHQGVELGAAYEISLWQTGITLTPRVNYTFSDLVFDDDPTFGDNELPGLPRHAGRLDLAFEWDKLRIAPNVQFQSDFFVDFTNTLEAPSSIIYGLEASYQATETVSIYLDARNLEDQAFIATSSTVFDAPTAPDLDLFTPGDGFGIFAGVRFGFGGRP